MSERPEVRAEDLTPETTSTLSGNEQFIMFDDVEGKRADIDDVATYIAGDKTQLQTTDKTSPVAAINELKNGEDNLKEDLQDKADQNGVYPDLSAGNITGDFHIDTKPYLYRALRDVASHIGSKAFDTLVGGTVAVNQLVPTNMSTTHPNGVTFTGANGIYTAVGEATAAAYHVLTGNVKVNDIFYISLKNAAVTYIEQIGYPVTSTHTEKIVKAIGTSPFTLKINNGDEVNETNLIPQVINLTQLFASDPTIADRAYTLEQGTAGAGIAWLKSYGYIRDSYIPYNQGTLQSVLTTGKKVVGFNLWDEETELGGIGNNGVPFDYPSKLRSKNYTPILPNTEYYITMPSNAIGNGIIFYDANNNFMSYTWKGSSATFTTPQNAAYLKLDLAVAYGTTYNHDICINLSKPTGTPKNGDYLPYESVSYQISPEELRGRLYLDADNNIRYDGDIRNANGTLNRKYGIVDLGTLEWITYNADRKIWMAALSDAKPYTSNTQLPNLITAKYTTVTGNETWTNGMMSMYTATIAEVVICDTNYTDVAAFAAAMSGVYLIFEKATSTTETVDPFVSPQQVFADGTEEYIDNRTVPIPVGHETKYELDLAEKLIGLPWDMSMIAPVEVEYKATRNYTTGQLFIIDNILYKATANIANGGTIIPNTNCSATTLAEVISTL